MNRPIALDLFAGTGWGVACQKLGIEEYGVEIMPEAIATREAAGMTTIFRDVWDGIGPATYELGREAVLALAEYEILVASPPCQTFSVAGKGAGRAALDDVLGVIRFGGYKSAEQLRALTAHLDDRTALVLTPLVYAYRDRPMHIVLEQVPTVLPVWKACAEVLRELGYSVVTGVLNAEQYGVPQTRKRAILIARRDGQEAAMPAPTHSRYYSRSPEKVDEGVEKWVSMAEALGWGMTERPMVTLGNAAGRGTGAGGSGGAAVILDAQSRGVWSTRPATTIVASDVVAGPGRSDFVKGGVSRQNRPGSVRVILDEAAALQSYPADFIWDAPVPDAKHPGELKKPTKGKQFLQIGNAVPPLLAEAILAPIYAAMTRTINQEEAA